MHTVGDNRTREAGRSLPDVTLLSRQQSHRMRVARSQSDDRSSTKLLATRLGPGIGC